MAKCKDCIHFPICEPYTDANEIYPEVGGCPAFKSKDDFVEVVRCKYCNGCIGNDVKGYVCKNELSPCYARFVYADFSCICGERRTDETKAD